MAHDYVTLTDIARINDANVVDAGVSDLLNDAPLLASLGAGPSSNGEQHKYLKETGAPVVGFRAANDGRENKKSTDTIVTQDLKILDASFAIDQAVAGIAKMGAAAYIAREARRHLRAAFFHAEKQLIYGSDAAGFDGLADSFPLTTSPMILSAGGTTASTGSSVWLIRTNDLGTDVMTIMGNGANIDLGETSVIRMTGTNGAYSAYWTPIIGWLGMQIGSAYSVARICNITEDSGKSLTDNMIYDALALFPASRQPNLIVMNRRSLKQLRKSRTATNERGIPAPRPTDVDGIPIVLTDAITSTEALLAAS